MGLKWEEGMHVVIEADVNDGDYISETTEISNQEELDNIVELSKNIPAGGHNWENLKDEELKDEFWDYMPYMDNEEVHTIESIDIQIIKQVASLL